MVAMRATKFTIDTFGGVEFDGYTAGEEWNGWACPYFTREQGMQVVDAHVRLGSGRARYDEPLDSFVFSFSGDKDGSEEIFSAVSLEGRSLYPIGAFSWIWEESALTL